MMLPKEYRKYWLKRAINFFWPCSVCRKLRIECEGKGFCADVVYKWLEEHFKSCDEKKR